MTATLDDVTRKSKREPTAEERAAEEMGVPFLGRLPLSLSIREASDAGNPPAASNGTEAEAFARLAAKLLETLETPVH